MNLALSPTRRNFLVGSAVSIGLAGQAPAENRDQGAYSFEVRLSEAEWRAVLTEFEYAILRDGGTEPQRSSVHWAETSPGRYACRGCNLTLYEARWKIVLPLGWAFFRHACPNAVLMSVEMAWPEAYGGMDAPTGSAIEVHCRRCGGHLGHIIGFGDDLLHCINGTSLVLIASRS